MKKFLSLVAIALIATPMFTSCDKDDDDNVTPPTPGKQELSLSVDKASLAAEATGTFTVTASAKAAEAIVVNVVSDKVANVTVPATVTIAKGTTSITGTYTAVAEGTAKITISTTAKDVTVKVADANITVTKKGVDPDPVESKIIFVEGFGFTSEESTPWSALKAGADAEGKGGYGSSVFYTTTAFDGTTGDPRIVIDNYGADVVGTTDASGICIAFVPVDTPIDGSLAWVKNEAHGEGFLGDNTGAAWFAMPNLVSSSYTALVGKEGYIVTNFVGFDDTDTAFQVRGWMKVSVTATSVTVIDYAVIVGDGAFKVGQTK
ncbi:MAG: hypothetical protein RR363_06905 [Rikenellaceae bacterium]